MEVYIGLIIIGLVFLGLIVFVVYQIIKSITGEKGNKLMNDLVNEERKMFDDGSNILSGLVDSALKAKKKILEDHAEDLEYIAKKEAEIKSSGVRVTAQAVKEGLTDNVKDVNKIYCKHCGSRIDSDSKFCKHCGKGQ